MHRYASPNRRRWLYSKGGTGTLFTRDALRDWEDGVSLIINCILSASENKDHTTSGPLTTLASFTQQSES